MTTENVGGIGKAWLNAFNAHDLGALLALYDDEAVHFSPKLLARNPSSEGKVRGKEALRAWWADCFARLPSLQYQGQSVTADAERVWLEYLRVTPGEATFWVAEVFEVRGGKIVRSRVYHG